jgi:CSLREA domain-containing protein
MRISAVRYAIAVVGVSVLTTGSVIVSASLPAAATSLRTFKVNTTVDAPDAHPSSGTCSTAARQCSLRGAIQAANALASTTVVNITVPAGHYVLHLGALAIGPRTVNVTGAGASLSIVSCPASAPFQLVTVAAKAKVSLTALKLTGGVALTGTGGALFNQGTTTLTRDLVTNSTAPSGGGLSNAKGATLVLVSTKVSTNQAAAAPANSGYGGSGGGIANAGSLTLSHSTISGNFAGMGGYGSSDPGGHGGNGGGISNSGSLKATSSTISGNSAGSGGIGSSNNEPSGPGGEGGGIYSPSGVVTLTNSVVSANKSGFTGPLGEAPFPGAGDGGGIWSSGTLHVTGTHFASNLAETGSGVGGNGGGIFNNGPATIATSTFTGNSAGTGGAVGGNGGGIDNHGTLTLTNSTLSGNLAGAGGGSADGGDGGGIYAGAGTLTMTGDTLSANSGGTGGNAIPVDPGCARAGVGGDGGALFAVSSVTITNSTLSGNKNGKGGFLFAPCAGEAPDGVGAGIANAGGHVTVSYSTIADNTDGINNASGTVTLSGTIVADNTVANCAGSISETSGYNLDSGVTCALSRLSDVTGKEPKLATLANNGGATFTQALLVGSPAIDHGGTASLGCPSIDQRAKPRPDEQADHLACDIGAYESQAIG